MNNEQKKNTENLQVTKYILYKSNETTFYKSMTNTLFWGCIKFTPFLLMAISRISGQLGSVVCYKKKIYIWDQWLLKTKIYIENDQYYVASAPLCGAEGHTGLRSVWTCDQNTSHIHPLVARQKLVSDITKVKAMEKGWTMYFTCCKPHMFTV